MLVIAKIESNDLDIDFVTLKNGKVLGIDKDQVVLYESMDDFSDMKTVDRQSITLASKSVLFDQIKVLTNRITALETIRDAIGNEVDNHDFSDAISRALDYHDFSDAISNALDNHDLTRVIEETLRGKTITIS